MWKYHVQFEPELEVPSVRKALLGQLELGPIFLSGKSLYVSLENAPETIQRMMQSKRGDSYNITLTKTLKVLLWTKEMEAFGNIWIQQTLGKNGMRRLGNSGYFDENSKKKTKYPTIHLWEGFHVTVDIRQAGPMAIVSPAHRFLRVGGKDTVLSEIVTRKGKGSTASSIYQSLFNTIVRTDYGTRTRFYRISAVKTNMHPTDTFMCGTESTTFVHYYDKKYGKKITDFEQPLLEHTAKSGQITYLIPEFCYLSGLGDCTEAKELVRYSPRERISKSEEMVKKIAAISLQSDPMVQFGMQISTKPLVVEGTLMKQEPVMMRNSADTKLIPLVQGRNHEKSDWKCHFRDKAKFARSKEINEFWAVCCPKQSQSLAEEGLRKLVKNLLQFGVKVPNSRPKFLFCDGGAADGYISAIQQAQEQQARESRSSVPVLFKFLVIVLLTDSKRVYDGIKQFLTSQGTVSQCIKESTLKNFNNPSNLIAQKINAKLGGALWFTRYDDIPALQDAVLAGIAFAPLTSDHVLNNPVGKRPNIVAVAATVDSDYSIYQTDVKQNEGKIATSIQFQILKVMDSYFKRNRKNMKMMIIFREGASEGDISAVEAEEVEKLKITLAGIQLAFIIVQKRINVRLFDVNRNAQPGTLVDDQATRIKDINNKDRHEFFLVSSYAETGTVSPTNYIVLYNSTPLTVSQLSQLAWKQCHMYYNWNGTVSAPAPYQNAFKLASLYGTHLGIPQPNLAIETLSRGFSYFL